MCIWAHTITILKKTPYNSAWRCAFVSCICLLDKNFPDPVDQHSWPLFAAQLPPLSCLTTLKLDSIPASKNWQTTSKKTQKPQNLMTPLRFGYLYAWSYLHHSSSAPQKKFNSKFAFCWLTQQTQNQPNPASIIKIWTHVNFLISVVVLSHMPINI